MMSEAQRRKNAAQFVKDWQGRGYEKGETHSFWLSLLRDVYGVAYPESFIFFEEQVELSHISGGNTEWYSDFGRQVFSYKVNISLPYNPTPGIYPREI